MREIKIESSSDLGVKPGDRVTVGKTEYEIMSMSTTHDYGSSGHAERVYAVERGEAMAQRFVFESDGMTLTGAVLMALREVTSEKESVCETDVALHIASRISERLSHHVACASGRAHRAEGMLKAECARSEVKDKEIVSMRMEINRLNEKLHSSPNYAAEMLSKNMLEAKDKQVADLREYIKDMRRECMACAKRHSAEVGECVREGMSTKNKKIGALNQELAEARQALDAQRKKNSHLRKCLHDLKQHKTPDSISFDVHFEGLLRGAKVCEQDQPLTVDPGCIIQTKIKGHGGAVLDEVIIRLKAKNVCASEPSPAIPDCRCWTPGMGGKTLHTNEEIFAALSAKEDVRKTIESQIRYQHDWFGPRHSSIKDDQVDAARYAAEFIERPPVIKGGGVCASDHVIIFHPDAKPKSGYLIMTPEGMVPEAETSDYAVMCPSCGRISPEHVGGCDACVKTCDRCDHQCKPDDDGVCCGIGGCFGRSEWTPKRRSE